MTHLIEKCECGLVIRQCRCPDPAKAQRIVSPCTHETGDLQDAPVVERETGS